MAWARFPVGWMRGVTADDLSVDYPLSKILWRDHAGSAMAAMVVLMLLSLRCNEENRTRAKARGEPRYTVRMSYDELQQASGFHRATLGKAISLLEAWNAIVVTLEGRSNTYTLQGMDTNGKWRKLPHNALLQGGRFALKSLPRQRSSLNALKIYILLLSLFNDTYKNASASYSAICQWTGLRRDDIAPALSILAHYGLVRLSLERDARHDPKRENDQSHRYWLSGLSGTALAWSKQPSRPPDDRFNTKIDDDNA